MMLDWPTFVLQRRINRPLGAVEQVLCDPHVLRAGSELDLGSDGMYAQLDGPFGVTFPPFGFDGASWWAPVSVHTKRGRTAMRFELEINAWDTCSTELLVRPRSRHPYRWSGPRLREYFRVAHTTADMFTHLLASQSVTLRPCFDSSTSTDAPRSSMMTRGTTSPSFRATQGSQTR